MRTESHCILLRGERKQLDKFRNDLLRQDRDKKELFLSQYLFCGLTPVYPLSAVKLLEAQENEEIKAEEGLLVLRTGLVRRRCRQKNGGSQLTAGCLVNTNRMAQLIEMSQAAEDCSFEAIEPCRFVSFQPEEFSRLIRVNAKLKKSLAAKLAGILEERNLLSEKNEAIAGQFTEQFKLGMQSVRMHYSI